LKLKLITLLLADLMLKELEGRLGEVNKIEGRNSHATTFNLSVSIAHNIFFYPA